MSTLLSRLSRNSTAKKIEPREIFMSLPKKEKQYEYPRDVQTEVWKKWFGIRDLKNIIIKMNTGSGKTLVGLLILQSSLNERKGPAVYVVPDKYLVNQVITVANALGIKATDDREDFSYSNNKSILVMPIQSLINGRSVFGMRTQNNFPLKTVLIDDVHVCLDTIQSQFTIKIPKENRAYQALIDVFSDEWKNYNEKEYIDIIDLEDPVKRALIPFWMWQNKHSDIYRILAEYNKNKCPEIYFPFPLLEYNLQTCQCIITPKTIEITPSGIDISKIKKFEEADRRIFMSATLPDDSVFVSNLGLNKSDIETIITPDNTNDLGDRLILFPKHLNSSINDDTIKDKINTITKDFNVVVIVPSCERAKYWDPSGENTATKENIEIVINDLKSKHMGLVVFVNRYDGIDLPDDACRMLVIDGLPPLKSEYDKYINSIDASSNILLRQQLQRIEQGMGRGVRSNSDSCCIILMGNDLTNVLVRNQGIDFFSEATREQYSLSMELWNLLKEDIENPTIDEIFGLANYSLQRDTEWIQMSKDRLSSIEYSTEPNIDNVSLALRKAFDYSLTLQWQKAVDTINEIANVEDNSCTKGYLLQLKAMYLNFLDKSQAQETLLSAHKFNTGLLMPIQGIQYTKSIKKIEQSNAIKKYIDSITDDCNDFIIHVDTILANLIFGPDTEEFEQAMQNLGLLLGFQSTRPEKETKRLGPDNLWAIGNQTYLLIECKSKADNSTLSRDYCNQLGGSVRWFSDEYGKDCKCIPILIHVSTVIDESATAVENMRVINEKKLEILKEQVKNFATALTQNENWHNIDKIKELLLIYKLRGVDLRNEYSVHVVK